MPSPSHLLGEANRARILDTLPGTIANVCSLTGLCHEVVRSHLRTLEAQGLAHIRERIQSQGSRKGSPLAGLWYRGPAAPDACARRMQQQSVRVLSDAMRSWA